MLIFTYKLEKYIKKKILPKLLIDSRPSKYSIKGSFRRRIPYVTDIDIVNDVYPDINKSNIYQNICDKIREILKDNTIILYTITCGTDDRYKIINGTPEEFAMIKTLLNETEIAQFNAIIQKYSENRDKMIFFINELIWEYYKIRWTPEEVLAGEKKLNGNKVIKFTQCVNQSTMILLQYFVEIEDYPIGIDMVVNYEPVENYNKVYDNASNYLIKLANYSKEYYYMLFPFRNYFRNNKEIRQELEDIIEKKYGLYKQLMVRIDSYHTLYDTNNLTLELATKIALGIVNDIIKGLPNFRSNIPMKIRNCIDNSPETRMDDWYILLDSLYDDVNADVNARAEKYFYKYLNMLPSDAKPTYLLANDYRRKIPLKYSNI